MDSYASGSGGPGPYGGNQGAGQEPPPFNPSQGGNDPFATSFAVPTDHTSPTSTLISLSVSFVSTTALATTILSSTSALTTLQSSTLSSSLPSSVSSASLQSSTSTIPSSSELSTSISNDGASGASSTPTAAAASLSSTTPPSPSAPPRSDPNTYVGPIIGIALGATIIILSLFALDLFLFSRRLRASPLSPRPPFLTLLRQRFGFAPKTAPEPTADDAVFFSKPALVGSGALFPPPLWSSEVRPSQTQLEERAMMRSKRGRGRGRKGSMAKEQFEDEEKIRESELQRSLVEKRAASEDENPFRDGGVMARDMGGMRSVGKGEAGGVVVKEVRFEAGEGRGWGRGNEVSERGVGASDPFADSPGGGERHDK